MNTNMFNNGNFGNNIQINTNMFNNGNYGNNIQMNSNMINNGNFWNNIQMNSNMINNGNFGNNIQINSNIDGNSNINLIFAVNGTDYKITTNKNMTLSTSIRKLMEKKPELKERNINSLLCAGRKLNNHQTIEENNLENGARIIINDMGNNNMKKKKFN